MAILDAKVASVLDRLDANSDDEEDEDALISALEDDAALEGLREQRLEQLHSELARERRMRNSEYGMYSEVKDEKVLMDITTSTKLCVVHFFKPDFNRCRVMDGHLDTLAQKHFDTRFLRINVENAPFLITKLKIQVLPYVLAFIDGISSDRIVGFEGLSHTADDFTTRDLEARLLRANVLVRARISDAAGAAKLLKKGRQEKEESEGDDEWD